MKALRWERTRVALTWMVLSLVAGTAPASSLDVGGSCPDKQATPVPARVVDSGGYRRCGVGIKILGVGGAILGERCPRIQYSYPAVARCAGASGDGMRCVPDAPVRVEMRECSCRGLVLPVIHTGIPTTCGCDPWRSAGTLENFKTVSC